MSRAFRVSLFAALAAAAGLRAERLPFRVFTTADGLAGDTVREIFQDSRGYLWIGTSSGLSRFGGRSFRNYDTRDGLGGVRIDGIVESTDGGLWVGTGQGLFRMRPGIVRTGQPVFERVPVPESSAGVGVLYADRAGGLWVGTRERFFVFDRPAAAADHLGPPREVDLPPGWPPPVMAQCPDGDLWFASRALLRMHDGVRSAVVPIARRGEPEDVAASLVCDAEGRIWIAGWSSILITWPHFAGLLDERPLRELARPPRFNGELPREAGEVVVYDKQHGLPDIYGVQLTRGARGMWLTSHDGALELGENLWRTVNTPQGLPEHFVQAVFEDRDGTVWFGTESRGLARLRRSGMVTYDQADGLPSDRISSLDETDDGTLLVGTQSRDLVRWDGNSFVDLTPRDLFNDRVLPGWGWNQFVMRDRRGRLWFPTARGLFRYAAPATWSRLPGALPDRRFTRATGFDADDIFRLYEDRRGDIWVSAIAEWPLQRIELGERPEIEREIAGARHGGAPTVFAEDRAGGLWMGFYLGGLGRRDTKGWRFYGTSDGVPPGFVNDLHLDRAGHLWVATGAGGVARIEDPTAERIAVRRYRVQEGLTTDSTRCLAEDGNGVMYVGHSRGLDRLDVASGRLRSYSIDDGLPNAYIWTCLMSRRGELWLGTLHGLVRFDPAAEPLRRPPAVSIAAVRAAGTRLPVPELGIAEMASFELAPERNSLEIDVEILGLDQQPTVRIQHRVGENAPWHDAQAPGALSFPHLEPGRYALEIRAVTSDGLAGAPARMAFRLFPPLAQRPWVRALAAALLALAAFAAYRVRVARLLAVERARTRIASDLHDDVGSGLSRIGMLGEIARRRLREAPDETASVLEQIGRETATLAENASEIIWSVDPAKDDFESVVVRLRRFAADLFEARDIQLRFSAPPNADQIELLPEVRRAVYLVLKESINNVAKHSGASAVEIAIELHDGHIRAEVRDDGHGIDPDRARAAAEEGHRGLPGMSRRAVAVGGEVTIDSRPGGGTRIALSVPLRRRRGASHDHAKRPSGGGDTTPPS